LAGPPVDTLGEGAIRAVLSYGGRTRFAHPADSRGSAQGRDGEAFIRLKRTVLPSARRMAT
jgi:hypothetical protein